MTISIAQAQLFLLAFTRVMAILVHVPVLAGPSVPNEVKVPLGIVLAAILIPWQPLPADAVSLPLVALAVALGRELLVGTLAGFASTLTFGAAQTAGDLMGLGGGFAAGQVLNPVLQTSGTALNQLFMMVVTFLFFVMNGHHLVLLAIHQTFVALPVNSPLPAAWLVDPAHSVAPLLRLSANLIGAGVLLALPVMAAALLADLTLGLLARVAPQVQVFFLGAPLKVGLGLLVLTMALAVIFPSVVDLLRMIGPHMLDLLGA